MKDEDKTNKYAQARIAWSLLKLVDANKDKPDQLDLLAEIAAAMASSQFFFIDWHGVDDYLSSLAHGDEPYAQDQENEPAHSVDRTDVRAAIEASIAQIEAEQNESR